MKTAIDVASRSEGDSLKQGLGDPSVRAFVIVMGALLALPTDRARARVLSFVSDKLEEEKTAGS